ncbi:hypothetical protein B0H15DRAFT_42521 [Mycena belliarum]|uniref:Uncharacterized protein n=1 Tax=Mycena belliarum TaxID=1033014 RepID=A0AAD6TS59_9AGAR|nr:hypothetical protein B0H15DRAFT_42521 [Mycena belliae]
MKTSASRPAAPRIVRRATACAISAVCARSRASQTKPKTGASTTTEEQALDAGWIGRTGDYGDGHAPASREGRLMHLWWTDQGRRARRFHGLRAIDRSSTPPTARRNILAGVRHLRTTRRARRTTPALAGSSRGTEHDGLHAGTPCAPIRRSSAPATPQCRPPLAGASPAAPSASRPDRMSRPE